jgi:NAD(P)-dependent dehydrogenase (short-subunit alcohol dehydrogenase family)
MTRVVAITGASADQNVISSIVGKRGVPYMGLYSATKFAQVGLSERLRAEIKGLIGPEDPER